MTEAPHEVIENMPLLSVALPLARRMAREAGAEVLAIREAGLSVAAKSVEASDIVTQADTASEAFMTERIRSAFPDHGIRGEEGTNVSGEHSPWEWVLDPIDGTHNFANGKPFSISVGLLHEGKPVLGVLHFPDDNVTLSAIKGKGAMRNGEQIRRRTHVPLSKARVGFDVSSGGDAKRETELYHDAMLDSIGSTRRMMCCTYAARELIEGNLDAYVCGGGLTPYDLAAGALILEEAGLVADRLHGHIDFNERKIPFLAATDPILWKQLHKVILPRDKRTFFEWLAKKYRHEMMLLIRGGELRKEDGWRNVVEHCLTQTAAAETLSRLLGLNATTEQAMCSTSAIHDWRKRIERTGMQEPARAKDLLQNVHPHQDLLNASNPDELERVYLGTSQMSEVQELQFYLDVITRENDIVPWEARLQEVEARSKELSTKAEGHYWEHTRELAERVEQKIFDKLQERGCAPGSPKEIPILIRQKIEERWKNP